MRIWYRFLRYSIILVILLSLIYSGCGEKALSIAKVRDNPEKYRGETIKIKGRVTEIFETQSLEKGIYQISDGKNSLWVKPADEIPKEGDEIEVLGEIVTGFSLKDKTYGVVLIGKTAPIEAEEKASEEK